MAFLPYPPASTTDVIAVLRQDAGIVHEIIHGNVTADVDTESGLVPSFAKVVKALTDEVNAATGVDTTLRTNLAAANSTVLVAGVEAGDVGRKFGQMVFVSDFGALSDGITDDTAAVQAAQNSVAVTGGSLIFPQGKTTKITTLTLTGNVDLVGFGHRSIIEADTILFPANPDIKNSIKNIRINGRGNNTLVNINKTWTSKSSPSFILDNVWLHNINGAGTLLRIYGARESSISKCWFSSSNENYNSATTAIRFVGDDVGGAMNIDVTQCQFVFLNQAIDILGTSANYQFVAGIRVINNMFIGLLGGLKVAFADYVQLEQNMMDFVNKPVVSDFCPNLKIRNNYLAAREQYNDVVSINNTKNSPMQWLDISNNRMFSYSATNKGNAVVLTASGGNIEYGNASGNDIDLVTNCFVLGGSGESRVLNCAIDKNQARSTSGVFALINSGAELNDIESNFAETSVGSFVVDNNLSGGNRYNVGNRYGTKRSQQGGKLVASGNGSNKVFTVAHNMISAPSVVTFGSGTNTTADARPATYFDATNIYFEFSVAPPAGSNNVVINWQAQI
jgi:hypothetical protein